MALVRAARRGRDERRRSLNSIMSAVANVLAVWVGKVTLALLRLLGRRGNALPGLVVEKLFPQLPHPRDGAPARGRRRRHRHERQDDDDQDGRDRSSPRSTACSPTTPAATSSAARSPRPSNTPRWSGRLPYDVAVFELDEAWAVRFVAAVAPRRALLLNVMRDQLDRFGEIDMTARLLGKVAAATTGHVVLNRDDERVATLAAQTQRRSHLLRRRAATCASCSRPTRSSTAARSTYADQQHHRRAAAPAGSRRHRCGCASATSEHDIDLRAEGPHNAQNATGAAALGLTFGLDEATVARGLAAVLPAFGRGQRFDVDGPQRRAAAGQEPGRVPADPAHARHHRRRRRSSSSSTTTTPTVATCRGCGTSTSARSPAIRHGCRPRARAPRTWRCDCATTRSTRSEVEADPEKAVRSAVARSRPARPSSCSAPTPRCGPCTRSCCGSEPRRHDRPDARAPLPARDEHLRRHRQRRRAQTPSRVARHRDGARRPGQRRRPAAARRRHPARRRRPGRRAGRDRRRLRHPRRRAARDGRRRRRDADDLRHVPDARPRVHHPGRRAHQGRRRPRRHHARPARAADRQQLRRHPGGRPTGGL